MRRTSCACLRSLALSVLILISGMSAAAGNCFAQPQTSRAQPNLKDTLEWLSGESIHESGDGMEYIEFESQGCRAVITEHRTMAKPEFVIRTAFDLSDLDPNDISVVKVFVGHSAVALHTRNYTDKIQSSDSRDADQTPISSYQFTTNSDFAARFARAIKRAALLCGARNSSF